MIDNLFSDMWEGLVDRTSGPLKLRFFLQPSIAIFLAIRAGLSDWRQGKAPFFWDFLADSSKRKDLFRDFKKSVGKLFLLACSLDCIYQLIVLHWVYLFDAVIIAALLCAVLSTESQPTSSTLVKEQTDIRKPLRQRVRLASYERGFCRQVRTLSSRTNKFFVR
jgi:hypothetical protein